MVKGEPRFAVMDGGTLRPLSSVDQDDALRKALYQALKAWSDNLVYEQSTPGTHAKWKLPGVEYYILPSHEMKNHVLLMSDGVLCKYAAREHYVDASAVESWMHFLHLIPDLPVKLSQRADELSEDRIQTLLDVMLDVDPFEPVEARIDAKNAEMRAEFLKDFPVLDSAGVHRLAGLKGTNTSQTVNSWRQKGRILGLPVKGKIAYPTFQFDADGQPYGLMERILAALPKSYTPWQRAFWFVSPKESLDGTTPVRGLEAGDDRIVTVAKDAGERVAG